MSESACRCGNPMMFKSIVRDATQKMLIASDDTPIEAHASRTISGFVSCAVCDAWVVVTTTVTTLPRREEKE